MDSRDKRRRKIEAVWSNRRYQMVDGNLIYENEIEINDIEKQISNSIEDSEMEI